MICDVRLTSTQRDTWHTDVRDNEAGLCIDANWGIDAVRGINKNWDIDAIRGSDDMWAYSYRHSGNWF